MNQKVQFIADFARGHLNVTDLCELYGISRKTGYKLIERYLTEGPAGLEDRSCRPLSSPNATPEHIVQALLEVRRRHKTWGAKKLLKVVHKRHPRWELPARSTVCDILKRNGLAKSKPKRRHIGHPGKPSTLVLAPNDLWAADFKGQFRTRDGIYCFPLTVTDLHSRYLLGCEALLSTAAADSKQVFTQLFREYGLPKRIRTDNGVPFATNTLGRLSMLSAWWVRLGIMPELIEPGRPQQNGSHERMHKTLKAEATKPPAANRRTQQRKFNTFRSEFNNDRPHESLDQDTPSEHYSESPREMPAKLPPLEYPDRFETRYVSANGGIRWNSEWVNVSTVCSGEHVGLEEIDDGVWNVYFGAFKLGRFHERQMKIEDEFGRLKRHNV